MKKEMMWSQYIGEWEYGSFQIFPLMSWMLLNNEYILIKK